MRRFIFLLIISASVTAQPIEGPYTIFTTDPELFASDPTICINSEGNAEVFYVLREGTVEEARALTYSLETQQIIRDPALWYAGPTGWDVRIQSIAVRPDGQRGLAVRAKNTTLSEMTQRILVEHQGEVILIRSSDHLGGDYFSESTKPDNFAVGNDYWCASTMYFHYLPRWEWNRSRVAYFQDTTFVSTTTVGQSDPDGRVVFRFVPIGGDTVFAWKSSNNGPGGNFSIASIVTSDSLVNETVVYDSTVPIKLAQTRAGRILMLIRIDYGYPFPTLLEAQTDGSHWELASVNLERDPDAVAFHPDYGFALLLTHQARLMIARIDTNGVEVQPLGIFYEPACYQEIQDADIAIDNNGNVVVLWTECQTQYTEERTLKIASVEWDAFLNSNDDRTASLPSSFALYAYPNPFNPTTTITFDLPKAMQAQLGIFDITGRLVATLANEHFTTGTHRIAFDGSRLPSGIYFARLQSSSFSNTRKLVLLK